MDEKKMIFSIAMLMTPAISMDMTAATTCVVESIPQTILTSTLVEYTPIVSETDDYPDEYFEDNLEVQADPVGLARNVEVVVTGERKGMISIGEELLDDFEF